MKNEFALPFRIGFWSSLAAFFFAAAFVVSAVLAALTTRSEPWSTIEAYAQSFKDVQLLPCVFCFLLVPAVLAASAALYAITPNGKRIWGLLGLVFSLPYAVIISVNYFLQLFVLRLNLKAGVYDGLSLLAMTNFHSIFFALEGIGYHFLCVSSLFFAFVFVREKRDRWLRGLFLFNGVMGTAGLPLVLMDKPIVVFATLGAWSLTFPAAMLLLALRFRRQISSPSEDSSLA